MFLAKQRQYDRQIVSVYRGRRASYNWPFPIRNISLPIQRLCRCVVKLAMVILDISLSLRNCCIPDRFACITKPYKNIYFQFVAAQMFRNVDCISTKLACHSFHCYGDSGHKPSSIVCRWIVYHIWDADIGMVWSHYAPANAFVLWPCAQIARQLQQSVCWQF